MLETDWMVWVLVFILFLPLHVGAPLVYVAIQHGEEIFRARRRSLIVGALVTAALGFVAALVLWPTSKGAAATAISIAFLYPWVEIFRARKFH